MGITELMDWSFIIQMAVALIVLSAAFCIYLAVCIRLDNMWEARKKRRKQGSVLRGWEYEELEL